MTQPQTLPSFPGVVAPAEDCCARPVGASLKVAIIGSGAAAFAAALRLRQGGAHVTMVERGTTGGTCVNIGCVPSKILLRAAQVAHVRMTSPFDGAITAGAPRIDRRALLTQLQGRVDELRTAKYEAHLAERGITLLRGEARFEDPHRLRVRGADGAEEILAFDRALIATGASPAVPPVDGLAGTPYWTSTEALAASDAPEHLLVLGGSYVALELAQAFLRLGSRVTLVARSRLLSRLEPDIGQTLGAALVTEGMRIIEGQAPRSVRYDDAGFKIELGGEQISGDRLLVATGRRPNTAALSLPSTGIATRSDGAILVDSRLRTSAPHIYAAGDCTTQPEYVYVAAAGGTRAAVNMLGGDEPLDLSIVPAVVFTDPQVATVGLDVHAAEAAGLAVESRTLPLSSVPRALVNFDTRGFIRLVAEAETGRLLSVQAVAAEAGELIQTAALAIRAGMTVEDIASQLFPYLTMVEGLKLCALSFKTDVEQLSCCAG